MNTPGHHRDTPDLFSSFSSRCQVTELVPGSPSYGVEMTFDGRVYQLFSNQYGSSTNNMVLLDDKRHLCHEPLKVFFQEFRKYVLGPYFGHSAANKHGMLLGLEGLDDPLVGEVEARNNDCTLWEFWEEAVEPTLRFQMHTYVSQAQMQETDPDDTDCDLSLPSASPSPSTPSPSSSPQDSTLSDSSNDDFVKDASSGVYLEVKERIVLDLDNKTVMDLDRRIVLDLNKRTIMDLDKKTVLYLDKKSILDLESKTVRNMTPRVGLGTTARNSVATTELININPTQRTNTSSMDAWAKRKCDNGYDADVSDIDSVCSRSSCKSNRLEVFDFSEDLFAVTLTIL